MQITTLDEKALRNCASNAVALSLLFLADKVNKQLLVVITHLCTPVANWHTDCQRRTRNVTGAADWLLDQISSAYYMHCMLIWRQCGDLEFQEVAGLLEFQFTAEEDLSEERLQADGEMAQLIGLMSLSLVGTRLRRAMWMLGCYPVALAKLASDDPDVAQKAWVQFKEDLACFRHVASMEMLSAAQRQILERSGFQLLATQQVVKAVEEGGGLVSPELKAMLISRCRIVLSTQICEDTNNVMKNDPDRPGNTKFRRPQPGYAAALAGGGGGGDVGDT